MFFSESVYDIYLLVRLLRLSRDLNGLQVPCTRTTTNLMPEKRDMSKLPVLVHFYAVTNTYTSVFAPAQARTWPCGETPGAAGRLPVRMAPPEPPAAAGPQAPHGPRCAPGGRAPGSHGGPQPWAANAAALCAQPGQSARRRHGRGDPACRTERRRAAPASGRVASPPAGRVRHPDGASRLAVRCALSPRYGSQRSKQRTGQRGLRNPQDSRPGCPRCMLGCQPLLGSRGSTPLHPRARAFLAGRRTREQR
jgi:hypothetical protein